MRCLEIRDVGFSYKDGTIALKRVSLALEDGEKVAIIGPNGAGKSTLLHLVAGFRMPFSGEVIISGRRLDSDTADILRRDLGLLFQDPDDQIFMPTVEEDVAFGPRNLKLGDVDGRVTKGLRSTGIEGLAKRKPHRLSYGMKKRVALAGTMAMDPKILLLDEPTSGLDPRSRKDLIKLLRSMDRSMLIATHDIEAAAEIVDRAIVLDVEVVMEGTMRDLVMAREALERVGLEVPPVSRLFIVLEAMGYQIEDLPVSMDQAVAELTKVINREGSYLHARIHDHAESGDHGHEHSLGLEDEE